VVDILLLSALRKDEVLIPAGCMLECVLDGEIIVIALLDREAESSRYVVNSKIRLAWRANRAREAFEPIPTDGIECYADLAERYK
jgi:hypothetical protein